MRSRLPFGGRFWVERLEERYMMAADPLTQFEIGVAPPPPPLPAATAALAATMAAGAATPDEVAAAFSLHSLPGALHTIYLDFDGYLTRETQWNEDFDNPNIFTPALSIDEDVNTFNDDEIALIRGVWERVSEDYRPFHVNVTTQDPGIEALRNTGTGDLAWGQRVVIGGSTLDWYTPIDGSGVGGVAYGSFTWDSDTPTFVFGADFISPLLPPGVSAKSIAEAASHEVGHTLGLAHDGHFRNWLNVSEDPPEWNRYYYEYYAGHGTGSTSWAPIMGVGYGAEVTQWSWSEYPDATNDEDGTSPLQDDLAIITTGNGFDYRVDDHGSTIDTATDLVLDADGKLFSGEGIIERRTDVDYFEFTVKGLGELVTFDITPFETGPNLDILAKVYTSAGVEVASNNPVDELYASFSDLILAPGTYYLSIDGAGKPITFIDPAIHPGPVEIMDPPDPFDPSVLPPDTSDWGYSDYGSLGSYKIEGTRKSLVVGVDFDVADGESPTNWNLFSSGGQQTKLSNLISETGKAMPYDLTISTTGTSVESALSSAPIDPADLPDHARPLDALDGYLSSNNETLTFTWSDLDPSTAYQVYVFGHADMAAENVVTITGGTWNGVQQTIEFTQTIEANSLVVNEYQSPGGQELAALTYFVVSTTSGEITITVDAAEGSFSAIAGLAIAPTEVGSIEGQKWNDRDGNRMKDTGEEGLEGWTIYLDTNNNGVLDFQSTPDQTVTQVAPNVPQALLDNNIVKNELEFSEVGEIIDVNVQVNITHSFIADMDITLVSPSGTRVKLMNDNGQHGDHLTDTIFDDAAARSISSVNANDAPFTGSFRPLESLSAFDGENASGIWTLEIRDDANGDVGVLNSWSLTITLGGIEIFLEPVTVTDAEGNYSFSNLQAGSYYVREHANEEQIIEGWRPSWIPPAVTVASEARVQGVDLGNWIPVAQRGSIQGIKFNDLDGDGEKDAEEPVLPDWIVYIDSNNNGQRDLATDPIVINNNQAPKQIKDFSQTQSQVTFEGLGTVLEVEITLNVTHSFVQDLDAHLISPSGQSVELFTGVGGQYNDLQNLTLADDASRSISTIGVADLPYTGRWRPEGLLSDFLGEDAAGIWTLVIRDNAFADQGTLNSWSLAITVGESFTTTSEDGSYKFENLPPDEYVIGEVPQLGWVQVPPADTSIPAATWADSQWTVNVEAFDDPEDPVPDSHRNVKNVNFGNQAISLVGDYSANGRVDAADYVLWRKTLATPASPPGSGADGNGSGMVDNEDHVAWMTNFGKSLSPGGLAAGASAVGETAGSTAALMVDAASPSSTADLALADVATTAASGSASTFDSSFVPQEAAESGRVSHRPAVRQGSFASSRTSDQALLAWVSAMAEGETTLREPWLDAGTASADDTDELDALDSVFAKLGDLIAV